MSAITLRIASRRRRPRHKSVARERADVGMAMTTFVLSPRNRKLMDRVLQAPRPLDSLRNDFARIARSTETSVEIDNYQTKCGFAAFGFFDMRRRLGAGGTMPAARTLYPNYAGKRAFSPATRRASGTPSRRRWQECGGNLPIAGISTSRPRGARRSEIGGGAVAVRSERAHERRVRSSARSARRWRRLGGCEILIANAELGLEPPIPSTRFSWHPMDWDFSSPSTPGACSWPTRIAAAAFVA